MSCYSSSNNKHFNAPPRMADGRNFTDYRPNHEINRHYIEQNKVKNSHDYRLFLSRNGENIIGNNKKYIFEKNGLFNCKEPYHVGTMLPERSRVVCNQHTCKDVVINEDGHGQGRQYVTDGKPNPVLDPLMQPEFKFGDNVCATPSDNFNYHPINNDERKQILRQAVPGGGVMLNGGDTNVIY